jgi:hypothetical protein
MTGLHLLSDKTRQQYQVIEIHRDAFKLHDSHVNAPAFPLCKETANEFKLLSLITSHMQCAIFHYDCSSDPPAASLRHATLLVAKGSAAYFRPHTASMTVPFRVALQKLVEHGWLKMEKKVQTRLRPKGRRLHARKAAVSHWSI